MIDHDIITYILKTISVNNNLIMLIQSLVFKEETGRQVQ